MKNRTIYNTKQTPAVWMIVFTLIIAAAMLYSLITGSSLAERYAPLVDAAMEIKLEATAAHLWFEEIISGDRTLKIEDVFAHLDQAERYARAMLEGDENREGKFVPLDSPILRGKVEQTLAGIIAFRKIARERWQAQAESGIGSAIDQRFDKIFNDFLLAADQVETVLQREMENQFQRFSSLQSLLIVVVVLLGAFLAVVLNRHERRRISDLLSLQAQEENLRITLDSIGDAVIATDAQGNISRMNPVAADLTGWTDEDARGKPLSEVFRIVHAETGKPAANPVKTVLGSGKVVGLANHTLLLAKDGKKYQISDSAAPIRDLAGAISGVVLVFRDVTEEYRIREVLQKSELRYRTLFEKSADAFLVIEGERFVDCNQATLKMLRMVSKTELLKAHPADLSPELQADGRPSLEKANEMITIAFAQGSHRFEWDHLRADGEVFPAEISLTAIPGPGQKILHVVWRDISKRKQAERTVRQLRNYLANIIDSMPSQLIGVDTEGRVTQWNREAQRVTGVAAPDAVGQPLNKVIPRLAVEMDRIHQAISSRKQLNDPKRRYQQAGETRFEDVTIYPLIANGIEGAVIRVDDVTERVRIEEMMVQSEKMLSIGGLAAGMAHEINNPLAGMMQTAEVISRRLSENLPANDRAAAEAGTTMAAVHAFLESRNIPKMLVRIRESGERTAQIVSNMLNFARKSSDERSSHDLAELLDRSVDLAGSHYDLKKKYDFRQIKIVREYTAGLPPIPCDSGTIQQVMLNILRNGAEALQEAKAEDRRPRLTLRLAHEKAAAMIRLEIEDNGPGMDKETSKRIFEPFFTTKPTGRGTGLGLSVSYFIITENHGGAMAVETQPGQGTKFIIRLPVAGKKS